MNTHALLWLPVGLSSLALCFAAGPAAADEERGNRSVLAFGALGDGKADDTGAFQKALNGVATEGGGIVRVPTGNYLIKGHLAVPDNVTLEGVFRAPTARSQYKGSTLLVVEGRGSESGEPFIKLNANAGLKGITVMYPEQDAEAPVPYPWCLRGEGDNVTVTDVLLVNPWNGVDLGTFPCGRHLVRGLYGQPLHTGLFVDVCLDCGRLEDIHTTFIGCHFHWPGGPFLPKDYPDPGHPGILLDGNGLTLDGCDFTDLARRHVLVGAKAKSVVVTATRFKGGMQLENLGKAEVVAGQNIGE